MMVILITISWTLAFILGFAISCLKLLLVTSFHMIHPLDPEQFGKLILVLALMLAFIPNMAKGFYLTLHGIEAAKIVQLITKGLQAQKSIVPYNLFYISFWAALCIIMLVVSVTYIPYKLKIIKNNNISIRTGEVNSMKDNPNFSRLLFVFAVFICGLVSLFWHNISSVGNTSYQLYVITVIPTTMLLMHALETDSGRCFIEDIANKLFGKKYSSYFSNVVAPSAQEQIRYA
jgi:hypothetical protein